jgi:hypothetical protein
VEQGGGGGGGKDEEKLSRKEMMAILKHGIRKSFKSSGADMAALDLDQLLQKAAERTGDVGQDGEEEEEEEEEGDGDSEVPAGLARLFGPAGGGAGSLTCPQCHKENDMALSPKVCKHCQGELVVVIAPRAAQEEVRDPNKGTLFDVDLNLGERSRARKANNTFVPDDWRVDEDKKKPKLKHEDECYHCGDGGDLVQCVGCPKVYHKECVGLKKVPPGGWYCPWHACFECDKRSSRVGGIMFRCGICPTAYCFDHWPDKCTRLQGEEADSIKRKLARGNYFANNVEYIHCLECVDEADELRKEKEDVQQEKEQKRTDKQEEKEQRAQKKEEERKVKEEEARQKAIVKAQEQKQKITEKLTKDGRAPTQEQVEKEFSKEEKKKQQDAEREALKREAKKAATRRALVVTLTAKLGREPTEEDITEGTKEALKEEQLEARKRKADEQKEKERFEKQVVDDLRVTLGRRREPSVEQKKEALKGAYAIVKKEKEAIKRVEGKKRKAEEEAEEAEEEKERKKQKRAQAAVRKREREAGEAKEEESKEAKKKQQRLDKKAKTEKEAKDGVMPVKKAVTAYAFFAATARKAVKQEQTGADAAEITKVVQAQWEALSEEAKGVYMEKELQDKARFFLDVADQEESKQKTSGEKSKSPVKKSPSKKSATPSAKSSKKTPAAQSSGPKKPRSAFTFFTSAVWPTFSPGPLLPRYCILYDPCSLNP